MITHIFFLHHLSRFLSFQITLQLPGLLAMEWPPASSGYFFLRAGFLLLSTHSYLVIEGWRDSMVPPLSSSSQLNLVTPVSACWSSGIRSLLLPTCSSQWLWKCQEKPWKVLNSTSWFSRIVYSSSWGHSIIYPPLVQSVYASWRAESKSYNICSLSCHLIWVFNCHSFILYSWPI